MDQLLSQIGTRLLERRKQLRLTQEQLADLAGITPQTISTAETGRKALRPENIVRLCEALGVSTDYLLKGEVTGADQSLLCQKIAQLPSAPYRHLEDIIDSYIAAINEREA